MARICHGKGMKNAVSWMGTTVATSQILCEHADHGHGKEGSGGTPYVLGWLHSVWRCLCYGGVSPRCYWQGYCEAMPQRSISVALL